MLRICAWLLLLQYVVSSTAHAQERRARGSRFGVAMGPVLWFELADERCEIDSDVVACSKVFVDALAGGRARFDVDLLRWLRVGAQLGLGFSLDGSGTANSSGGSETQRSWFVPMGAHAYTQFAHRRTNWWLGPELLYSLRVDQVTRTAFRGAREEIERDVRSGLLLGGALGFDTALGSSRVSLGLELAAALSIAQAQQLPKRVQDGTLSAMTRMGLLLRVAL